MPKAIMFVQSSPSAPDREDEYNDWYSNTHLGDVLQFEGVHRRPPRGLMILRRLAAAERMSHHRRMPGSISTKVKTTTVSTNSTGTR